MKRMRRIITFALAALMLAGCGGSVETIDENDKDVSVVISYWPNKETDTARYELYQTYLDIMKERYPDITIVPDEGGYGVDTFMALAATNQLPNVYRKPFTEPQQIIKSGYAKDITKFVEKYGYDKKVNSQLMNIVSSDGKYYGIPYNGYMIGMWYNTNILAKAGMLNDDGSVKYPKTYEELAVMAKEIKDKTGIPGFAIQTTGSEGGWMFMNIAWSFGTKFMEQDESGKWKATFNSPECKAALSYIKDLKWKYDVLPSNVLIDTNELQKIFATDNLAMSIAPENYPSAAVTKYKMSKENIAVGPVMEGPTGQYAQVGGDVWMFSPDTTDEQVDAAFKWFELLGYTPDISEDALGRLEETVKADYDAQKLVSQKALKIWIDNDRLTTEKEIYDKYKNVNPVLWSDLMPENVKLQQEEPQCTQNLYKILSNAMQEVLTNENADVSAIIENAAQIFQKDYLDKIEG